MKKIRKNEIAGCYRFIEVACEDGVFYDLVHVSLANEQVSKLKKEGYDAKVVRRGSVPPCRFRWLGEVLSSYCDASLDGGLDFYINKEST